jgi:hypothetical protein
MTVLWLLNMVLQFLFTYVVFNFFLAHPATPERLLDLLAFRLTDAHHVIFSDPVSRQSMSAQLCQESRNDGLHLAGSQVMTRLHFASYLDKGWGLPLKAGQVLCLLCLLVWACLCIADVKGSFQFAFALWSVPRHARSRLAENRGEVYLERVSAIRRYMLVVCVVIPRLVLTCFLFCTGVVFLCYTVNLQDLLLDTLALGFILDIDELLFSVLTPARVLRLHRRMRPVPLTPMQTLRDAGCGSARTKSCICAKAVVSFSRWIPVQSVATAVGLACFLVMVFFDMVSPITVNLQVAADILCEGRHDFVYSIAPDTTMVHAARTPGIMQEDLGQRLAEGRSHSYMENTVLQMTELHRPLGETEIGRQLLQNFWPDGTKAGQIWNNDADLPLSIEDAEATESGYLAVRSAFLGTVAAAASTQRCRDISAGLAQDRLAIEALISSATEGHLTDCNDSRLASAVHWANMTQLRALCPQSSNCSNPWYFFSHADWGCPPDCKSDNQVSSDFAAKLEASPCVDDLSETWRLSAMSDYLKGLRDFATVRPGFDQNLNSADTRATLEAVLSRYEAVTGRPSGHSVASVQQSITEFTTFALWKNGTFELAPGLPLYKANGEQFTGCAFWTDKVLEDILDLNMCSGTAHQTIAFLCPMACRCPARWHESCPRSCV